MPKHLANKTNSTKYVIAAFCGTSVAASTFTSPAGQKYWTDDVTTLLADKDMCPLCDRRYFAQVEGGV